MQGPAHLVLSWFTAESCGFESARNRRIIALAGLSPDFDVVAYVFAYAYYGFDRDLAYENVWVTVHHHYTHGLGFAILAGLAGWLLAKTHPQQANGRDAALNVGLFSCLAVLLHVFFDLIAAGARFPVYPLWPFSDMAWTVDWSWELRDWPNQIVTLGCLAAILAYARLAGRSPLEALNYDLDAWVVAITRQGTEARSRAAASARKTYGLPRDAFVRLVVYLTLLAVCALVVIPVADDLF